MITFVDPDKIRRKRDPGRCYLRAGFRRAICPKHVEKDPMCASCDGRTEGGLIALQMLPSSMPPAEAPMGVTLDLLAV